MTNLTIGQNLSNTPVNAQNSTTKKNPFEAFTNLTAIPDQATFSNKTQEPEKKKYTAAKIAIGAAVVALLLLLLHRLRPDRANSAAANIIDGGNGGGGGGQKTLKALNGKNKAQPMLPPPPERKLLTAENPIKNGGTPPASAQKTGGTANKPTQPHAEKTVKSAEKAVQNTGDEAQSAIVTQTNTGTTVASTEQKTTPKTQENIAQQASDVQNNLKEYDPQAPVNEKLEAVLRQIVPDIDDKKLKETQEALNLFMGNKIDHIALQYHLIDAGVTQEGLPKVFDKVFSTESNFIPRNSENPGKIMYRFTGGREFDTLLSGNSVYSNYAANNGIRIDVTSDPLLNFHDFARVVYKYTANSPNIRIHKPQNKYYHLEQTRYSLEKDVMAVDRILPNGYLRLPADNMGDGLKKAATQMPSNEKARLKELRTLYSDTPILMYDNKFLTRNELIMRKKKMLGQGVKAPQKKPQTTAHTNNAPQINPTPQPAPAVM